MNEDRNLHAQYFFMLSRSIAIGAMAYYQGKQCRITAWDVRNGKVQLMVPRKGTLKSEGADIMKCGFGKEYSFEAFKNNQLAAAKR